MKKLTTLIFLTLSWILLPSTSEAQIWIVNNNYDGAGHFDSAQAAHDAVTAGDTLYLVPSEFEYELELSKELHFFGTGYLFEENQISGDPKTVRLRVNVQEGPNFDQNLGGAHSSFNSLELDIKLNANHVKINECIITSFGGNSGNEPFNTQIEKSYIIGSPRNGLTNSIITNSYIFGRIHVGSSTIINNIIGNNGGINIVDNSTIENNIFLSSSDRDQEDFFIINRDNTVSNNIFTISEPANSGVDNQFNIDPTTLFVGPDGNSTDAQWQLSEISPAIGAGTNGDDIGMYGGANPYQLSGLPDIPRITAFTAPATGSANTGLPVSITIESNN